MDCVVTNKNDSTIMVFYQPFSNGMAPNQTLSVTGEPFDLISGHFSGDSLHDLAVVTQSPSGLLFFVQELTGPSQWSLSEETIVNLEHPPTTVACGDTNGDSLSDILVLSSEASRATGFHQAETDPRWSQTPAYAFPTGAFPRNALIASLDSDGAADIAVASARSDWTGSSISIYPAGASVPSNSDKTTWTFESGAASMFDVGDINGDDYDDLVLVYQDDQKARLYPSFDDAAYEREIGFEPGGLILEDFNGDGYDDILVSENGGPGIKLWLGSSTLTEGLTPAQVLTASGGISDIASGDLNNDSRPDLVVATVDGSLDIFVNTGSLASPLEEEQVLSPTPGDRIWSVVIGDFDSDGLDDVAYTNSSSSLTKCAIDILMQHDGGTWSLPRDVSLSVSVPGYYERIWSGDLDGDGGEDLAAMLPESELIYAFYQVHFGTQTGADDVIGLPEVPEFVGVADATDDGRADLLVTYASADLLFLHKQDGGSIPEGPSMVFVAGAYPDHAMVGDATGDHRGDLLVYNSGSGSVSAWRQNNFAPVADAGGPYLTYQGDPLRMDGSVETGSSELAHMSYRWDFGDGTVTDWISDPEPIHAYQELGTFTITMEASDPEGLTDTDQTWAVVLPKMILRLSPDLDWYSEFQEINFSATVVTDENIIGYEWEFDSDGPTFDPDRSTTTNYTVYRYNSTGFYTARVRATNSEMVTMVASAQLEVRDAAIDVEFDEYVAVTRNPEDTREVTFDPSLLVDSFPDITTAVWEFGDGATLEQEDGAPATVVHSYDPTRDYAVNLTVTDDDQGTYILTTVLRLKHPTIVLISPEDGAVVTPGRLLQFAIRDDALPLASVTYSVDEGEFQDFVTMYEISTEGWEDGRYSIVVRAEDGDGNVVTTAMPIQIVIDSTDPVAQFNWTIEKVRGGDKVDVMVDVQDENIGLGGVVLYVKFPGSEEFSGFIMTAAAPGRYHATIEVPVRSGTLEMYVTVVDLAGHSTTTDILSVEVKLRFMDAAWPFIVLGALMLALGTVAYFFRESRIAVDETFVIYNDGRLISHSTRRLRPGMDDQIMGGMLVAIQDFVRDSFKEETSFTLRKLTFGDRNILIEKGQYLHLAVVLHGKESKKVASRMQHVVQSIEKAFAEHVVDWDGDLDKMRGVNEIVKRLYSKAPGFLLG